MNSSEANTANATNAPVGPQMPLDGSRAGKKPGAPLLRRRSKCRKRPEYKTIRLDKTTQIGRNDPCRCGSGIKYKKCCMRPRPLLPSVRAEMVKQEPVPIESTASQSTEDALAQAKLQAAMGRMNNWGAENKQRLDEDAVAARE